MYDDDGISVRRGGGDDIVSRRGGETGLGGK